MTATRQLMGEEGERIAEAWFVARGWRIMERRFRSGHRDIDLVAEYGLPDSGSRIVVFVEVKARASNGYGGPLGAVHWRKQRELAKAARDWVARFHQPGDVYRFDVVGVLVNGAAPEVVHVENAFAVR
jgi:putative endonuclease